jgi:hypothetical protein
MRSMKAPLQLCALVLFTVVVLLPYAGKTQGKLNRTAPGASGHPIMTKDGGDPVPRLPQLPKKPSAFTA